MTAVLGIVAALELERRWIRAPEPHVEVGGVGAARAEEGARRLLGRGVTALVSWGVAGGLDPGLSPGTVVLPENLICPGQPNQRTDRKWRDRLLARIESRIAVSTSPLLQSVEPITSPEEKHEMHRRTGAAAVDQESAAVAAVASEAGIPFIAVRVIVDGAEVRLPEVALTMCDEGGRLKKGVVMRLFFQPREWPGMFSLGRANSAAGRSMRSIWSHAGPDLALSGARS